MKVMALLTLFFLLSFRAMAQNNLPVEKKTLYMPPLTEIAAGIPTFRITLYLSTKCIYGFSTKFFANIKLQRSQGRGCQLSGFNPATLHFGKFRHVLLPFLSVIHVLDYSLCRAGWKNCNCRYWGPPLPSAFGSKR